MGAILTEKGLTGHDNIADVDCECHHSQMTTRRTFLLTATTLASMSIVPGIAPTLRQLPSDAHLVEDDFDISGFYVAVSREFDGSITLSELINNKLKERETFAIEDSAGILRFIERVRQARIVFIDWHGITNGGSGVRAQELAINWTDENPLSDLPTNFRECAELLSFPRDTQLG